jgi:hypothetical protein
MWAKIFNSQTAKSELTVGKGTTTRVQTENLITKEHEGVVSRGDTQLCWFLQE